MEEDKLFISLMQVFIAQMDSALKISNIISPLLGIEISFEKTVVVTRNNNIVIIYFILL